jgi:hypothetical protein
LGYYNWANALGYLLWNAIELFGPCDCETLLVWYYELEAVTCMLVATLDPSEFGNFMTKRSLSYWAAELGLFSLKVSF